MKVKENKHFDNIDLLKFIAVFSVVLIHNFYANGNFLLEKNFETIITFLIRQFIEGVPIFIAVNGYLIINKKFDLKKHLHKCLKIFILIICWSFILIIATGIINNDAFSFKMILSNIFLTNISNKYTGILWFLQDLLTIYLIFPVLKTLHDKDRKIYDYLFIIVIITTIGYNVVNIMSKLICSFFGMKLLPGMIAKFLSTYVPFNKGYYILYLMLGGYLFEYKEELKRYFNKKKIIMVLAINTLLIFIIPYTISKKTNIYVGNNFNYSTLFLFVHIIMLFIITEKYNDKKNIICRIIKSISQNSLGIYFIHIIVTRILGQYIKFKSIGLSIIYSIFIMIISWIISAIIKKIPYIRKLVEM